MSDLADLAADVAKDLPASVRKAIDTAIAQGWELNKPGMTLALRFNHPTDELAEPVYITWAVGRTPKGNLSFRFMSCGTRGLVPLSGADLLEYLSDPTIAYPVTEELEAEAEERARKKADKEERPQWDKRRSQLENLQAQLGATVLRVENTKARDIQAEQRARLSQTFAPEPAKAAAPPLRVFLPDL